MPTQQPRILVVEDSRSVADILACALEQEGCTVLLARTGRGGVELAQRTLPDVIALDVGRECLGGADVIAALRADPMTREIPIVAISARARELPAGLERQVRRVFGEPFYPAEVAAAIVQIVDQVTASRTARPAVPR